MDPVTAVNLVLCLVILVLGIVIYDRKKDRTCLYVGVAFGLFGISHLATLLNLAASFTTGLIVIRTLAYLVVLLALYRRWAPEASPP
jgi:uncharacterized membrane protein (UPF0136 family)